jgi:signal transduction histidine kinase
MRPASLDQLGVEPALEALVARSEGLSGLQIRLRTELRGEPRLKPAIETTVYRVVQEALTNVAKHAEASTVDVAVIEDDATITIRVADDGGGFSPGQDTAGFGLIGMRERLRLAGGRLEVRSDAGRGTTIHASIPVTRPAADTG